MAFIFENACLKYLLECKNYWFYLEKACVHALLGFAHFKLFHILDSTENGIEALNWEI